MARAVNDGPGVLFSDIEGGEHGIQQFIISIPVSAVDAGGLFYRAKAVSQWRAVFGKPVTGLFLLFSAACSARNIY